MNKEKKFGIGNAPAGPNLRLETLVRIRWVAVFGQTIAVLIVWLVLNFDFLPGFCFMLIAVSAILNAVLSTRYPANQRISQQASIVLLTYDIVQLAMLLFLTGGLQNPFSVLLLVPVVISATTLSTRSTLLLGAIAILSATVLVFFHLPLPWIEGEVLQLPRLYIAGMWVAIICSLSFMAIYAFRVADEARKLADALAATEIVLEREQHLSDIDGLAAAAAHELGTPLATIALVSKEMIRELETESLLYEDAQLLRSQAERCREILKTLTSLSTQEDQHIGRIPFSAVLDEVSAPHREFGIEIDITTAKRIHEPLCMRNPGILYGLGNLVENAVDHARERVQLNIAWDDLNIWITINDDGPGFDGEMSAKIGEPFVKSAAEGNVSKGLGLGLFIAKTLLERTGAKLSFTNGVRDGLPGACVRVEWPRDAIEVAKSKPQASGAFV
ncbi:MAG: ActS/PrrB/RegB family redox-sensitive histidine kinase [Pseudomonadota bacterium]